MKRVIIAPHWNPGNLRVLTQTPFNTSSLASPAHLTSPLRSLVEHVIVKLPNVGKCIRMAQVTAQLDKGCKSRFETLSPG